MKKRILSVLLAVVLLATCIPFAGLSVSAAAGDHVYYEAETNDTKSTANGIGADYTVYGIMGHSVDYDYYRFTLSATSTVQLGLISDNSAMMVFLNDSNGTSYGVFENTDKSSSGSYLFAETMSLPAGTYYIWVLCLDYKPATDLYMLYLDYGTSVHTHTYDNACDTTCNGCGATRTTSHTYSSNDDESCNVCGYVRPLGGDGTTVAKAIVMKAGTTLTKSWTKSNYSANCYNKIVLANDGYITFTMDKPYDSAGKAYDVWLRLYSTDGTEIWNARGDGDRNAFTSEFVYKIGLAAGTYYLNLDPQFSVTSGTFSVNYKYTFTKTTLWEAEPNGTKAQAKAMTLGKTYNGVFGDVYLYMSQEDVYKVKLTKGKKYRITMGNYMTIDEKTFMLFDFESPSGDDVYGVSAYHTKESGTSGYWTFYAEESGWHYFTIRNGYDEGGYDYTLKCDVEKVAASNLSFNLSKSSFDYNGKVQKPTVTVYDGSTKVASSNYTVSYTTDCKNAGTHKVKITMKGDYTGTKTLSYSIKAVSEYSAGLTAKLSTTNCTYDGTAKKPTVTIKDKSGNKIASSNYTVTYPKSCTAVGSYRVEIKYKGNYSGSDTLYYYVNAASASKCKVTLSKTTYTYNGKVQKPTVTVKDAKGKKLTTSSYSVSYSYGCKSVGTYTVTIRFKGNYTGSKTLTYKINPAGTTVKSLTAAKKSLKVAVTKKTTEVTGYEIQYSTSKNFKSAKSKTLTSYSKTSLTLSGLSAKKTYYVRVRTYKTVGGKKYYSGWSTIKSKKTK